VNAGDAGRDLWEEHAGWWQREFTDGADVEYVEQILPLARELLGGFGRILDVGAGEGQVGRALGRDGASFVVGVDPVEQQVLAAAERGGMSPVRARAEAMPVARDTFDAAVACLVFEHLDDLEPVLDEVRRALRRDGRFVVFLNHPLLQTPGSGWIDDHLLDPPEQYWRVGPYLPVDATVEEVQKGVHLRFVHRPLSVYVNALADRGLLVERMLEPPPPPGFLALSPDYRDAATIPRLLVLVTRRVR
jgi:SAM-dependent methyltransferase